MSDLAFIFPGQGSQFVGMGREFYDNFAKARELFDCASDVLKVDFKKICFDGNDFDGEFLQSSIFLHSFVVHDVFVHECGKSQAFALGHSLGEVSAVAICGGFTFENALKFTHIRAKLMSQISGGMLVVLGLEDDVLENFCATKQQNGTQIYVANYNAPSQIVLACQIGCDVESELKSLGAKRAQLLKVPVPSHCPLLGPIVLDIKSALNLLLTSDLNTEVISNSTKRGYRIKHEAIENITSALIKPVFYKQIIAENDHKVSAFVEFGGSVLGGLNKRITQKPTFSITNIQSLKEAIKATEAMV